MASHAVEIEDSVICVFFLVPSWTYRLLKTQRWDRPVYVYELFSGLASPCLYAAPQIFAGPSATARWVGIQNLCGILSGILAPALTGALVDASGSYVSAFVVAGAANVIGFIGWVLVMPRIAPVEWNSRAEAAGLP